MTTTPSPSPVLGRADGTAWTPDEGGFWALTIRGLDSVLDGIERHASAMYQSDYKTEAGDLREAAKAVRAVRDGLLARQYDLNRSKR